MMHSYSSVEERPVKGAIGDKRYTARDEAPGARVPGSKNGWRRRLDGELRPGT